MIVLDYIVKSAMCYHSSIYGDETTQGLANFVLTSDKDRFVPSDFSNNVRAVKGKDVWTIDKAASVLVAGGWLEKLDSGSRRSGNPAWRVVPGLRQAFKERREARVKEAAAIRRVDPAGAAEQRPDGSQMNMDKRRGGLTFAFCFWATERRN